MSTPPLRALLSQRRFDEAETLCRHRVATNPADAEALAFLLPRLMERREMLQARVLAEQAAGCGGGPRRDLLLMLGRVRAAMRDDQAARAAFRDAAAGDPDDWLPLLLLGDVAERMGDGDAALAARLQALHRAERTGALTPDAALAPGLQAMLQRAIPLGSRRAARTWTLRWPPCARRMAQLPSPVSRQPWTRSSADAPSPARMRCSTRPAVPARPATDPLVRTRALSVPRCNRSTD